MATRTDAAPAPLTINPQLQILAQANGRRLRARTGRPLFGTSRRRAAPVMPEPAPSPYVTASAARPATAPVSGAGRVAALGRVARSASTVATGKPEPKTKTKKKTLTPEESRARTDDAIRRRFHLRDYAAMLVPNERVCQCQRKMIPDRDGVTVYDVPSADRARFGDLMTCGSVWMCPLCAPKISEVRRQDLGEAVKAARSMGKFVVFLTLTVQHYRRDNLKTLLLGLRKARRYFTSGRAAKQWREKWGYIGEIRALEVTNGYKAVKDNGWHPHIHSLLILDVAPDIAQIERELLGLWQNAVALAGLRNVTQISCKVRDDNKFIADYITKFGREPNWRSEHELTKAVTKIGKDDHMTPMQLLGLYADDCDRNAGALWREYALAFKGSRQLFWSRGLRALLLPDREEQTDQAIAERVEADGVKLGVISSLDLDVLVWHRKQADFLVTAHRAGWLYALYDLYALKPPPWWSQTKRARHEKSRPHGRDRHLEEREAAELGLSYSEYRRWCIHGATGIMEIEDRALAPGSTGSARPAPPAETPPAASALQTAIEC